MKQVILMGGILLVHLTICAQVYDSAYICRTYIESLNKFSFNKDSFLTIYHPTYLMMSRDEKTAKSQELLELIQTLDGHAPDTAFVNLHSKYKLFTVKNNRPILYLDPVINFDSLEVRTGIDIKSKYPDFFRKYQRNEFSIEVDPLYAHTYTLFSGKPGTELPTLMPVSTPTIYTFEYAMKLQQAIDRLANSSLCYAQMVGDCKDVLSSAQNLRDICYTREKLIVFLIIQCNTK